MSQQIIQKMSNKYLKKVPPLKSGQTVKVFQKIIEGGKEREQAFEGLIIRIHGAGIVKTITVRKIVDGIGVERIFPIHSPNINKIEIKKEAKVRRSKLYYMRERSGKSARLVEKHFTKKDLAEIEKQMEASMPKKEKEEIKEEVKIVPAQSA